MITIEKPADPVAERRRLLWEAPDTMLEQQVLANGIRALPQVWEAWRSGTAAERRAAAALLAWYPDVRSIEPILTALAQSPGALTREQLLFDLNMIVLTKGEPATEQQRNTLAAKHMAWLYEQLASP